MVYNNELIGIIDKIHSNADNKATPDNYRSTLSVAAAAAKPSSSLPIDVDGGKSNLIDFNEHIQSTETNSFASKNMAFEEISKQNVIVVVILWFLFCGKNLKFCFAANIDCRKCGFKAKNSSFKATKRRSRRGKLIPIDLLQCDKNSIRICRWCFCRQRLKHVFWYLK